MASLFFGFKDIVNSYPTGKSIFDLSSILINDKQLKSLNPKRYNFYIKFVNGLANPYALEQFFYKTKEAKLFKEDVNEKMAKLGEIVRKLNMSGDTTDIKNNVVNKIKDRYNLSDEVKSKLSDMIKGGSDEMVLNKREQPMHDFLSTVQEELPQIASKQVKSVDDLLINKPTRSEGVSKASIIKKAEEIYNTYRDDVNPDKLGIKMMDRAIFIVTTLIIRIISLLIVQWGLDTNLINSFHAAFNYYCGIYLLLFAFITMFVNVIIAYPVVDLFSTSSIINIPNFFYYFYIYTNGIMRLLLHITFIIIILFIPFIISVDKYNSKDKKELGNISGDQERKKKIYDTISLFSFIIWIMTSIVAFKF